MHNVRRSFLAGPVLVILLMAATACSPADSTGFGDAGLGEAGSALLSSCAKILPEDAARDILGDENFVGLVPVEPRSAPALVERMVTDGVACGISGDDTGEVLIGQLAMDEDTWAETQADFEADGFIVVDGIGATGFVTKDNPDDEVTGDSGYAWKNGILYYAITGFLLMLLPIMST